MKHGAPYEQCHYCRKWVKLSGFFGGIHVCLSPEDRAQQDIYDLSVRQSQHAQMVAQQTRLWTEQNPPRLDGFKVTATAEPLATEKGC